MKRFVFPLEGLERLRRHKLDLAREALRAAALKRQRADDAVAAAEAARDRTLQEYTALCQSDDAGPALITSGFSFLQELRSTLQAAREAQQSAVSNERRCREAMLRCRSDVKVTERLREKARSAHDREMLREEERELPAHRGNLWSNRNGGSL